MIRNFDTLLLAVNTAKNRSQLEMAHDVADTFLDTWLNASAITTIQYHQKKAQLDDAYHKQLLDFDNLNPMQTFNQMLHKHAGSNHE